MYMLFSIVPIYPISIYLTYDMLLYSPDAPAGGDRGEDSAHRGLNN